MHYSEALKHLYLFCDCVDWDVQLTSNLISLEQELLLRLCTPQEQLSPTKETQDQ